MKDLRSVQKQTAWHGAGPENLEPAQVKASQAEGELGAVQQRRLQQRREEGHEVQHIPDCCQRPYLALSFLQMIRIYCCWDQFQVAPCFGIVLSASCLLDS